MVVASVAVRQEAGRKHDDGVDAVAIVALIRRKKKKSGRGKKKKGTLSPVRWVIMETASIVLLAYFLPFFFWFASHSLFLSPSLSLFSRAVSSRHFQEECNFFLFSRQFIATLGVTQSEGPFYGNCRARLFHWRGWGFLPSAEEPSGGRGIPLAIVCRLIGERRRVIGHA